MKAFASGLHKLSPIFLIIFFLQGRKTWPVGKYVSAQNKQNAARTTEVFTFFILFF